MTERTSERAMVFKSLSDSMPVDIESDNELTTGIESDSDLSINSLPDLMPVVNPLSGSMSVVNNVNNHSGNDMTVGIEFVDGRADAIGPYKDYATIRQGLAKLIFPRQSLYRGKLSSSFSPTTCITSSGGKR